VAASAVLRRSNTARAGASVFWSRAASPFAALVCHGCATGAVLPLLLHLACCCLHTPLPARAEWPPRIDEFATEPLTARFGVALPSATVTNAVMQPWSAQLLDWYDATATAADNYTCTVSAGGAIPASRALCCVSCGADAHTCAAAALQTLRAPRRRRRWQTSCCW
jgi:hypothetical protein